MALKARTPERKWTPADPDAPLQATADRIREALAREFISREEAVRLWSRHQLRTGWRMLEDM